MEEKETFDIFSFAVERKELGAVIAFVFFLMIADPSKASVLFGIIFCTLGEAVRSISLSEDKEKKGTLTKTGIYGYVRNPEALGNFMVGLGIFVMGNIFLFTLVFIPVYLLICIKKIEADDELLREKYKEGFEEYALNVPGLLPRFTPYEDAKLRFDLDKIKANKEYRVWLAIYVITIIMFLKT